MGKVAALVLTEEDKQVGFYAVSVGSPIVNPRRNPSSADIRRHLPLGEGFWVPQKMNGLPISREVAENGIFWLSQT